MGNVISAVFVDGMVVAQEAMRDQRRQRRVEDVDRWQVNMARLILRLLDISSSFGNEHAMMVDMENGDVEKEAAFLSKIHFSTRCLAHLKEDEEACAALEALDVDPCEWSGLRYVVDPNLSGTMCVQDLIEGVRKLRGDPIRGDTIKIGLMLKEVVKRQGGH